MSSTHMGRRAVGEERGEALRSVGRSVDPWRDFCCGGYCRSSAINGGAASPEPRLRTHSFRLSLLRRQFQEIPEENENEWASRSKEREIFQRNRQEMKFEAPSRLEKGRENDYTATISTLLCSNSWGLKYVFVATGSVGRLDFCGQST